VATAFEVSNLKVETVNRIHKYAIFLSLITVSVLVGMGSYFLSAIVIGKGLIYSVAYALTMTSMTSFMVALLFKNYTENVGGEE